MTLRQSLSGHGSSRLLLTVCKAWWPLMRGCPKEWEEVSRTRTMDGKALFGGCPHYSSKGKAKKALWIYCWKTYLRMRGVVCVLGSLGWSIFTFQRTRQEVTRQVVCRFQKKKKFRQSKGTPQGLLM